MKTNNFRGDLSDISAKKTSLPYALTLKQRVDVADVSVRSPGHEFICIM